jgi:hypothetical protein
MLMNGRLIKVIRNETSQWLADIAEKIGVQKHFTSNEVPTKAGSDFAKRKSSVDELLRRSVNGYRRYLSPAPE